MAYSIQHNVQRIKDSLLTWPDKALFYLFSSWAPANFWTTELSETTLNIKLKNGSVVSIPYSQIACFDLAGLQTKSEKHLQSFYSSLSQTEKKFLLNQIGFLILLKNSSPTSLDLYQTLFKASSLATNVISIQGLDENSSSQTLSELQKIALQNNIKLEPIVLEF